MTDRILDAYRLGRRDQRAADARLATEHGALYFAEPRPCTCKPDCGAVTAQRLPFAELIARQGHADG